MCVRLCVWHLRLGGLCVSMPPTPLPSSCPLMTRSSSSSPPSPPPPSRTKMKDSQFSSKAYGTHEYKDLSIDGRVQLDLYLAIQRDHKLSSYSLNAVPGRGGGAGRCWWLG